MTIYGTQGQTLAYDTEATFGTADGSAVDLRYESLTFPTAEKTAVADRPKGRENWADHQDRPILIDQAQDGAISITQKNRLTTSNYDVLTSALVTAGGAGGDTSAADTGQLSAGGVLDTAANTVRPGRAQLVTLTTGAAYPVLGINTEGEGTSGIITMAPPAASAAGAAVNPMITAYPKNAELSNFGHFVWTTRGDHTTAPDLAYEASGCGLSAISTIVIEPNTPVTYTATFSCAKIEQTADTLDAESMGLAKVPVIDCNFEFAFAAAPASWAALEAGLTRSVSPLIRAEIELNHAIVPIPSVGSDDCIGGIQGYYAVPGVPRITVEMLMDKDYWDDFGGDNEDVYMHFVQPSTDIGATPTPAWGLWFPRCYQVESPVMISEGDYYRMTLTYEAVSARFAADTENNAQEMAPYYAASGGYVAA